MADRSTTLRVVIAGDASQGVKALRDLDRQMKTTDDSVKRSAKGVQTSLKGVEDQAKRTSSIRGGLMGAVGGRGLRNVAEAGLTGTVNPLSSFQSAALANFGGAEKLLSGVSTRALAVGAGLTAAGFAAAKFGQVSVRSFQATAEAVDTVQDVMGGTAEEASALVNFAGRFGVEAEALAGAQAKLAVTLGKNSDALTKYGVEVARAQDGSVDLAGTLANIADAYTAMSDPTEKAALLQAVYGKSWVNVIDLAERGGDAIREAGEAARSGPIMSEDDLNNAREFNRATTELSQQWREFTTSVGRELIPVLTDAVGLVSSLVDRLGGLSGPVIDFGNVGDAIPEKTRQAIADYHNKARGAEQGTRALGSAVGGLSSLMHSSATFTERAASALSGFKAATQDIRTMRETTTSYASALAALDEVQTSSVGSGRAYADAVEQGAEQIASAEESLNDAYRGVAQASAGLAKAREQAAKQVQDAEEAAAEAAEDYAKVMLDSAEQVAEAEEEASKRVVDAQERMIEVRERAARQVRDASERLSDARQDAADALQAALGEEDTYKAQRLREEAVKDLARAERDYGEDVAESQKDVADAETDTAETQREAAKSVQDAHERAAEQVEQASKRVSDAQEAVAEAHQAAAEQIEAAQASVVEAQRGAERSGRDLEKAMRDAARAQEDAAASAAAAAPSVQDMDSKMQGLVDSTFAEVFQMRQLGASSEETQPKIDAARVKIEETARALGWSKEQTEDYIRQLYLIPSQVNTQVVLTMDAYQFRDEMRRVGESFSPTTRALFDSGIIEVIGGYQAYPQFATGGVYRAPPGQTSGLAMLHDREAVFTPDQLAALGGGGGGTTVVVHGSVISERDLMDIMARAQRRGYRG